MSRISSAVVPPAPTATSGPNARIADDADDQLGALRRHRAGRGSPRGSARRPSSDALHLVRGALDLRLALEAEPHGADVGLVQQARGAIAFSATGRRGSRRPRRPSCGVAARTALRRAEARTPPAGPRPGRAPASRPQRRARRRRSRPRGRRRRRSSAGGDPAGRRCVARAGGVAERARRLLDGREQRHAGLLRRRRRAWSAPRKTASTGVDRSRRAATARTAAFTVGDVLRPRGERADEHRDTASTAGAASTALEHAPRSRRPMPRRSCRPGCRRSPAAAAPRRARAGSPQPEGSTRSPWAASASAHRIAGPPALVTIATRSPRGSGWRDSSAATSNISPIVSVRITPACANSASTVRVGGREHRAGVRRGGALPGRRAPALDRDHRLGGRHAARDPPELARVPERLEVEQDRVRALVRLPVLEEVVAREIGLVRRPRRTADRPSERSAARSIAAIPNAPL